jgi:hypothetical protein
MTIKLVLLSAVGFAVCMSGNAFAASSTTLCWGQYRTNGECLAANTPFSTSGCTYNCGSHPYQMFFPCDSGGNSGFNPAYVCQSICHEIQGCTVNPGPSESGNQCGYRWATIVCQ